MSKAEALFMNESKTDKESNKIIAFTIIQYLCMFFICYSSICVISLLFNYIFDPAEFFLDAVIGHVYGFAASSLALILIENSKSKLSQKETTDE
jgi:hypothetical protein